MTVASVDRTKREVTLNAPAGVSAKRHDLAVVTAVNNALDVLTATASSQGEWGDDLSVQILPMVGAQKTFGSNAHERRKGLTRRRRPTPARATPTST